MFKQTIARLIIMYYVTYKYEYSQIHLRKLKIYAYNFYEDMPIFWICPFPYIIQKMKKIQWLL